MKSFMGKMLGSSSKAVDSKDDEKQAAAKEDFVENVIVSECINKSTEKKNSTEKEKESAKRLAEFELDPKFKSIRTVGYGDYGFLAIAKVKATDEVVAVRKSYNVFGDLFSARELTKELRVIRSLGHPNVECLLDVFPSPSKQDFFDLFVVTRKMDSSIAREMYNNESIPDDFIKNVIFQILCGLKHIHSANIVHRDLKSVSILLKDTGLLQIANFQAAVNIGEVDVENDRFVGHSLLVCSYVRSPEMILRQRFVTPVADIWGVGINLWELLGGRRLIQHSSLEQAMFPIFRVTGINAQDLGYSNLDSLVEYLQGNDQWPTLPESRPFAFEESLPGANAEALDLLRRMMKLNPTDRITVDEALNHPYLLDASREHDSEMNRHCNQQIDLTPFGNAELSESEVRASLLEEIQQFQNRLQFDSSDTVSINDISYQAGSKS
mmetsp:Transcript_27624/g.36246  ORF Transcript_27624/g.36246 Transcript_27624/m.36246 type:complete len:438 (+) Transcript_27624:26-1339(+)